MQENFTEIIANEVESYPVNYCDDESYLDEIDFLNNNLRTFGSGLSELMRKCGYNGGDDPSEKSYHLCRALKKIGADISDSTVHKWFSDESRPKIQGDSREKMFQICFALNADAEKTEWFFHHVYFDRCFDCRQLKEAVYLFCMKNGRTYEQALSLYEKVRGFTDVPEENDQNVCYTVFMNSDIRDLSSEEEFIEYVRNNPQNFKVKNKKILELINLYMSELSHPAADRAAANFMRDKKNKNAFAKKIPKECGLILRWLYEINDHTIFKGYLEDTDVTSMDFLIFAMTESKKGLTNKNIPSILRTNFPSKMTISKILNNQGEGASYDAMRKMLILLKFMSFWCNCRLAEDLEYSPEELAEIFFDELNPLLLECGYSELFAGNPYDWLFMHSAYADDPITFMQGYALLDVE